MSGSWNPHALPFRPGAIDQQQHNLGAFAYQHAPPPQGPQGLSTASFVPPPGPPPPPHPHMFNNEQEYAFAVHHHTHAYHHWMMYNYYGQHAPPPPNFPLAGAFAGRPPHMQPYGPSPFMHQQQRHMFTDQAQSRTGNSQTNFPHGAINEETHVPLSSVPLSSTPPLQEKPTTTELAANEYDEQNEPSKGLKPSAPATGDKGRYGDQKIMLPAPQPTEDYMAQAAEEPSTNETPGPMLVILDLNGTVLYRPNRNARTMIQRPFLKPFLRFLFNNFHVMIWSSARPDTVRSLVNQALDEELRLKLVAQWARDSFGLSPENYNLNVQVYKDLELIWSQTQIQSHHPDFETGGRFGQHNTVLIDDSVLKANAQPHNLLEIPTFSATPEQMQGDVLREVAGYLEALKYQSDVSKFIRKHPFVQGGQWTFDWPDNAADVGEISLHFPAPQLSKKAKKKQAKAAANGVEETLEVLAPQLSKKAKKKQAKAAAAATAAAADDTTATPLAQTSASQNAPSFPSGPMAGSIQRDW